MKSSSFIDIEIKNLEKWFFSINKALVKAFIGILTFSLVIMAIGLNSAYTLFNKKNSFVHDYFVIYLIVSLILCMVLMYKYISFEKSNYTGYSTIEDGDEVDERIFADDKMYVKPIDKEKASEIMVISPKIEDATKYILGCDKYRNIYSLKENIEGFNYNRILSGASRSGKGVCLKMDILQYLYAGDSMILADSKGDLYQEFGDFIRSYGAKVKLIIGVPELIKYSDAFNPLKYVDEEHTILAEVIATTIILQTEGDLEIKEYFSLQEKNCFVAAILYVTCYSNRQYKSFKDVLNLLRADDFDQKFEYMDDDNPAKVAFDIYAKAEPRIRGQIRNGLTGRLSVIINDKNMSEIFSNDEIDLIEPYYNQCFYFVVMPDTTRATLIISSLFINMSFMMQTQHFDRLSNKEREKLLEIRYELDEFKAIGKIPDFDIKISTFASRKITSDVVIQDIDQLKHMFPDKAYSDILANSSIQAAVKCGDMETAKYFEELFGLAKVVQRERRFVQHRRKLINMHNEEYISEKTSIEPLYSATYLKNIIHKDYIIWNLAGYGTIKLKKYKYYECPRYRNDMFCRIEDHAPEWRLQLEKTQKEKEGIIDGADHDNIISSPRNKFKRVDR